MTKHIVRGSGALAAAMLVAFATIAMAAAPSRIVVRNPENGRDEFFGRAATGVGSTIAVGAPGLVGRPDAPPGRVDVLDAATGAVLRSIANPTPSLGDAFGAALAAVGNDLLVGAPFDDTAATNAGAAYLFDGVTGALVRTFTLPGAVANQSCGYGVAALGGNVLIGCQNDAVYLLDAVTGALLQTYDVPALGFPFRVGTLGSDVVANTGFEVYRLDGATGAVVQTYAPPAGTIRDFTVVGANVLIGATGEIAYLMDGATGLLLHAFPEPPATWTSEFFGSSVAAAGDRIVIGARGAAYVYDASSYALVETILPMVFYGTIGPTIAAHSSGFVVQDVPRGAVATGGVQIFDVCGNGFVADSETCDDGNRTDGDGCSSRCRLEHCGASPATGCLVAGSRRSKLALYEEHSVYGEKDAIKWKWAGVGSTPGDFGDPAATASSTFCLWDRGDTVPRLLMQLDAPAGRTCQGRPCWSRKGTSGFKRLDGSRNPDGLSRVDIRARGTTHLSLVGSGPTLGVPEPAYDGPYPFQGTVVTQLVNSGTGTCWEARYGSASRNDHRKYRASSD